MNKKDMIICRCEDVTLADIHQKIDEGYQTFEDLKRMLRVGMGPCQGNTCGLLIQKELASYLGKNIEDIKTHRSRPVLSSVTFEDILREIKDEN